MDEERLRSRLESGSYKVQDRFVSSISTARRSHISCATGYKYERASARAAGMGSLRGGYYTIEFRICPDREQQLGIPNWVTTLPEVVRG